MFTRSPRLCGALVVCVLAALLPTSSSRGSGSGGGGGPAPGMEVYHVFLNRSLFKRVDSVGRGVCAIEVNYTTGEFTLSGYYKDLSAHAIGIGFSVPGRSLPGLGKRPILYSCISDSFYPEYGNFFAEGVLPIERLKSLRKGKARVVIHTTRYYKGEIGGPTRYIAGNYTAAFATIRHPAVQFVLNDAMPALERLGTRWLLAPVQHRN